MKLTEAQQMELVERWNNWETMKSIIADMGIARRTAYRYVEGLPRGRADAPPALALSNAQAQQIFEETCAWVGVGTWAVMGRTRKEPFVWARHIAMYRIRHEIAYLPLKAIGLMFDRDHSSVHYAISRIAAVHQVKSLATRQGYRASERVAA